MTEGSRGCEFSPSAPLVIDLPRGQKDQLHMMSRWTNEPSAGMKGGQNRGATFDPPDEGGQNLQGEVVGEDRADHALLEDPLVNLCSSEGSAGYLGGLVMGAFRSGDHQIRGEVDTNAADCLELLAKEQNFYQSSGIYHIAPRQLCKVVHVLIVRYMDM